MLKRRAEVVFRILAKTFQILRVCRAHGAPAVHGSTTCRSTRAAGLPQVARAARPRSKQDPGLFRLKNNGQTPPFPSADYASHQAWNQGRQSLPAVQKALAPDAAVLAQALSRLVWSRC